MGKFRQWDRRASLRREARTIVGSLLGAVLGSLLGLLEGSHHARATEPIHYTGYAVPIADTDDCDHDPLVAWALMGLISGSVVGGVGGLLSTARRRARV